MEEKYLSIGKVAKLLGVSTQTIRRWQREGKIQELRSPTNRRLYSVREVRRIMGVRHAESVVIYARVSSAATKDGEALAQQVERLKRYAEDHGYDVIRVFQEQASGVNENRQQLDHLLNMAEQREFQRLLIEYPDRLARTGYRYLERFFADFGVKIESTHVMEPKASQQELALDLLKLISVFSGRLYGTHSQDFYQKVKNVMREMKKPEVTEDVWHDDSIDNA
jgi:excisionase family DNA binding protein